MNRKMFSAAILAASLLAADSLAQTAPRVSGGANLGSAQLYAVVAADGDLIEAQSKGTLPCDNGNCTIGNAQYRVHFARDISRCSATASVAAHFETNSSNPLVIPDGFATVTGHVDQGTEAIIVSTYRILAGALDPEPRPFTVQVIC